MARSISGRSVFVLGSILLHAGIGVGVFAAGVWNIERLDGGIRAQTSLAMLAPLPEASGGAIKLPEVKVIEKEKKIVKEPVQPTEKTIVADTKPTTEVVAPGSGSDVGSGSGSGSAGDPGHCLVNCGGGGSGSGASLEKPVPKKEDEETLVGPNVLTMNWLTGSRDIHPSDNTKTEMLRAGHAKTMGIVKVCVSETGQVSKASMLQSTKYPAYDAQLLAGVRDWTYRPFAPKGRNVRVCGVVTFVYVIK